MTTPAQSGYSMPAEWEPHEGTWLQWPHDNTYPDTQMRLEHIWLMMVEALHQHETVHVIVPDERRRQHLDRQVAHYAFDRSKIDVYVIPTEDVSSRDSGPIFVTNDQGELAATDWNFNGWGERYPCTKDREVPAKIADILSIPRFTAPIVLEGGGVEVNGAGTFMATRTSIINPNRNPGKSQAEIEQAIRDFLGITHVIWLSGAPGDFCDSIGDSTDYHVDGEARFVDDSTVLYSWTDDKSHPEYPYLKQHLDELRNATTESGRSLTLVPLPMPECGLYSTANTTENAPFEAGPVCGVYANYYVANGVVLVPVYGIAEDVVAKGIIAEHFPGRKIIGIPTQLLAELGGMMHCVTQQQPAVQWS
jgi:agmatine deiminase